MYTHHVVEMTTKHTKYIKQRYPRDKLNQKCSYSKSEKLYKSRNIDILKQCRLNVMSNAHLTDYVHSVSTICQAIAQ